MKTYIKVETGCINGDGTQGDCPFARFFEKNKSHLQDGIMCMAFGSSVKERRWVDTIAVKHNKFKAPIWCPLRDGMIVAYKEVGGF